MKRLTRRRKFTLIELLVSMAVFSVLLVVCMRLFSGAQRLWLRSEQKTNAFADARVAMEFAASRIQGLYYTEYMPFYIYDKRSGSGFANNRSEIWFASNMTLGNGALNSSGGLRFFKLHLCDPTATKTTGGVTKIDDDAGKLQLRIYRERHTKKRGYWTSIFPPYNDDNRYFKTPASAFNQVEKEIAKTKDKFSGGSQADKDTLEHDFIDIIENVVDFKLEWYNALYDPKTGENNADWALKKHSESGSGAEHVSGTYSQRTPPYMVEMEISVIDSRENFLKWHNAETDEEKKEIFAQYGYTFRRAVLTGTRSAE